MPFASLPSLYDAQVYFALRGLTVVDFENRTIEDSTGSKFSYPAVYALVEGKHNRCELWYFDLLHGGGFWSRFP